MSRILDGPAGPTTLANARAPRFLRVVTGPDGSVDCLDQLDDIASTDETIHVYEMVPGTDRGRALVRLDRPRTCVWMAISDYRHLADVDGERFRENDAWRAWVLAQTANGMEPESAAAAPDRSSSQRFPERK